jgi:hypothetical protein
MGVLKYTAWKLPAQMLGVFPTADLAKAACSSNAADAQKASHVTGGSTNRRRNDE